jgi:hypothetical protein
MRRSPSIEINNRSADSESAWISSSSKALCHHTRSPHRSSTELTLLHTTLFRSILILFSRRTLGLPNCFLPFDLGTKIMCAFLILSKACFKFYQSPNLPGLIILKTFCARRSSLSMTQALPPSSWHPVPKHIQRKKDDRGRACSTHGEKGNAYGVWVVNPEGKRPTGKPIRIWGE